MGWLLFFGLVALAGAIVVMKTDLESADKIASVVGAATGLFSLAFTANAIATPAAPAEQGGNTLSNSPCTDRWRRSATSEAI